MKYKLRLFAKVKTDPREYDNCYLYKVVVDGEKETLVYITNFIRFEDADKFVRRLEGVEFVKDYEISESKYNSIRV